MSEHSAYISWTHSQGDFLKGTYSREHTWRFDGGATVPASPALTSVPTPYSNPANVDPEEAFVAAISSCHMLTFLHLASRAGFEIASYEDSAMGFMATDQRGISWVERVTLRPRIGYVEVKRPKPEEEQRLHHDAHAQCYIANSVRTAITVEPPE